MSLETILEIRKELKERKPEFIRQDYQRRKRLGRKLKWRKPKGIHSKIRHQFKGRRKMPSPGYKSPRKVKGLHSSGLKIINMASAENIKEINNKNEGIVVAKNVGMKKRLEILKLAKELNINVLNLNVDEQIKKIEEMINSKKKVTKETKKEEVKKEKKAKETKEETEKSNEDSKKELNESERKTHSQLTEKKEKDKVLTKRV